MIKVEVLEDFTFKRFNELKNTTRKSREEKGKLFKGDTFECTKEIADYLLGDNPIKRAVVKVIEIIPEKPIEKPAEKVVKKEIKKEVKKDTNKKTTSKKTIAKKD